MVAFWAISGYTTYNYLLGTIEMKGDAMLSNLVPYPNDQEPFQAHPMNNPFCDDPKCRCHENQVLIGILAGQVEEGLLTSEEATRIVEGKAFLWEVQ